MCKTGKGKGGFIPIGTTAGAGAPGLFRLTIMDEPVTIGLPGKGNASEGEAGSRAKV